MLMPRARTQLQAHLIAIAIAVVGQFVAFVPNLAPQKQLLISVVSGAIAFASLCYNAVHALIASRASAADIERGVGDLVKAELGRVDLNALVGDALKGENVSQIVQSELRRLLGSAVTQGPIIGGRVVTGSAAGGQPPSTLVAVAPVEPPPAA